MAFPLLSLPQEVLLEVAGHWTEHPYGLPLAAHSRALLAVLADPAAVASRAAIRFGGPSAALVPEMLRAAHAAIPAGHVVGALLADGADPDHSFPGRPTGPAAGACTALQAAVALDLPDCVRALAGAGAGVEFTTEENRANPMMFAAGYGSSRAARALVEAGASPDGYTHPEGTHLYVPLEAAAHRSHLDMVRVLLELGARADVVDPLLGSTPLIIALGQCARKHMGYHTAVDLEIARLLLAAGANPDGRWYQPRGSERQLVVRPIFAAGNSDDLEVVSMLLNAGAAVDLGDENGLTGLACAARHESLRVMRALLDAGADPNHRYTEEDTGKEWTLLALAASKGRLEVCRALLDGGAQVDLPAPDGLTPLMHAVSAGAAAVQLLLERGATLDLAGPRGETALACAARMGLLESLGALLAAGASPDRRYGDESGKGEWTPLARAARDGRADVCEALLEASARVDIAPPGGWTPLTYATAVENSACARALLAAGADPEGGAPLRGPRGTWTTPLVEAAAARRDETVRVLLHAGARVDRVGPRARTALAAAAGAGAVAAMETLLDAGAAADGPGGGAERPLRLAVAAGRFYAARLLLDRGARADGLTRRGLCAWELAAREGRGSLAVAIRKREILGDGEDVGEWGWMYEPEEEEPGGWTWVFEGGRAKPAA